MLNFDINEMAKGIKTGGRVQGTPNLLTKELRERLSDFLDENWEQIEKDFKTLEPEKRVMLFEKLLQYKLPRNQLIQTPDIKPIVTTLRFVDFQKGNELNK